MKRIEDTLRFMAQLTHYMQKVTVRIQACATPRRDLVLIQIFVQYSPRPCRMGPDCPGLPIRHVRLHARRS